jgi:acetyltransferase
VLHDYIATRLSTLREEQVVASVRRRAAPATSPADVDVELRPLGPGDSDAVVAVFEGMSSRSRRLRFLLAKPRLTAADVRHLVAVDSRDHVALLASSVHDRRPVAIARFVRDRDDAAAAEVAVEVVDDWQGRGVGTVVLRALVRRAVEVGVRRFTLVVSDDNRAVQRLLQRAPGSVFRVDADRGTLEYVLALDGVC